VAPAPASWPQAPPPLGTAPPPPGTAPFPGPGPPAPEGLPGYGGPVPPGGWQQPIPQLPGWAGAPLASWGVRAVAYVIDGLIVFVPIAVLGVITVGGTLGITGGDEDTGSWIAIVGAVILWFVLAAAVWLLYAPLLMARSGARNGQTWGKQMLAIRVVRDNGLPETFWQAALRCVVLKQLAVGVASSIVPFVPWFLDYFWPLWDDQNRALHDMAASTHVVRA
jgi:uncharacterized RDD family membrane protein YckC